MAGRHAFNARVNHLTHAKENPVTPTEIKAKVQDTHRRAMSNASLQMSRDGGVHHLFRDVKLYGRDAGVDFVETNIGQIVQEAVSMAECKRPSLGDPRPTASGRRPSQAWLRRWRTSRP